MKATFKSLFWLILKALEVSVTLLGALQALARSLALVPVSSTSPVHSLRSPCVSAPDFMDGNTKV